MHRNRDHASQLVEAAANTHRNLVETAAITPRSSLKPPQSSISSKTVAITHHDSSNRTHASQFIKTAAVTHCNSSNPPQSRFTAG